MSSKCVQFVQLYTPILAFGHNVQQQLLLANAIMIHIELYRFLNRWINIPRVRFQNRHRSAATFSDASLYGMRITRRYNVARLTSVLFEGLDRWECDTGVVEDLEVGFMMFLYWASFPRKLFEMQIVFGREYSQITRVLKAIWNYINLRWGHLVNNNLAYFVPRLKEYNRCFKAKWFRIHGAPGW